MKKLSRLDARAEILALANKHRLHLGVNARPYTARHLNRAVFVVRQMGNVPAGLLAAAGFRERAS